MTSFRIGTVGIQGRVGDSVRLGTPTDGELDGIITLDPNSSVTDTIGAINQATAEIAGDKRVDGGGQIIYVDPNGDNSGSGTIDDPLRTIDEAGRRAPLQNATIQLSAGDHVLVDHVPDPSQSTFLQSIGNAQIGNDVLNFTGTTSVVQSVTPVSSVDNVMTVSETLTPGSLRGNFISFDAFPPFNFFVDAFILGNTANTITFAFTTTSMGGFSDLPTSPVDILRIDSRILPPDTNTNFFVNRLYVDGPVAISRIEFDGNNGTGGNVGPSSFQNPSGGTYDACIFRNWSNTALDLGTANVTSCWFEDNTSTSIIASGECSINGSNVYINSDTCIQCLGRTRLGIEIPFIDSCGFYLAGQADYVLDNHVAYNLDANLPRINSYYCRLSAPGSRYLKGFAPVTRFSGSTADWVTAIYSSFRDGVTYQLLSVGASIGATAVYINDTVNTISLADYNAGNPPASGVRLLTNDRGSVFVD